ncbi:DEAD/DEAH box helicase family protein [Desulfonatronovibrio hydrogenovorans]|uniref:DEAD/DEAH box helicase family protein n=1 Tax=Desulfonatronovibrio hydrogenovorans TaxID=53245 RepID=UPI000A042172|nr:DEAD/DEAH box helicase family protein [Desulfonatronovibrio hydrogenovorans]
MTDNSENNPIYYQKLVRDKIPAIIKKNHHHPFVRTVSGLEFVSVARQKLIEEVYELYSEVKPGNETAILKESADVLEIVLAILKENNLDLNDLISALHKRKAEKGGFDKGFLLESVDGDFQGLMDDHPGFIFSHLDADQLIHRFRSELEKSDEAWIATAFCTPGITNILTSDFERFIQRGGSLKVILSTMGCVIRPEYLSHMRDFVPGLDLKVFHPHDHPYDKEPDRNFHVKAYIFRHRNGKGSVIIGSSNLTTAGFSNNIEWNYYSSGEINIPGRTDGKSPWQTAVQEFDSLWSDCCVPVSDEFLYGYQQRYNHVPKSRQDLFQVPDEYGKKKTSLSYQPGLPFDTDRKIEAPGYAVGLKPNVAQAEALEGLEELRNKKAKAGAVIAATGVGKTYLAAFDFQKSGKDKVLYIAHRENILGKARESFADVIGADGLDIFSGQNKNVSFGARGVFAMVQTMSRKANLEKFHPREFDYIVLDEFHHAMAQTYRKIIEYFQPDFLLGLTATPERMDGKDVLSICDYNIAYELRLFEAIDRNLLCPFHYFAVHDPTDYSKIAWKRTDYDPEELTRILKDDTRTKLIANNLKKFMPYQGKIKALAFCSSIDHARYTAYKLKNDHNIDAIALTGESPEPERRSAIARIEDENDTLSVVTCVDIFNEGVDIPRLSHVLMLRPTQSFTVFFQQLGRGLRKINNKESLVVIDFVGNFRTAHVAPIAMAGYNSIQEYIDGNNGKRSSSSPEMSLPKGCFISPDIEVKRIWENRLREIVPMPMRERLKALYDEIIQDLGLRSPGLSEFFSDPQKSDPHGFINFFGSWIKTKDIFNDLSPEEKKIIGTSKEQFLEYLEKDLNPVKSYKMVVLQTIISLKGTSWKVEDIARGFLEYYINHPEHLHDYEDLAKQANPHDYRISSVVSHIKNMPLKFLSNKESDWFILDRENDVFSLKPELTPHWDDSFFKTLIKDRLDYALRRYFYRKTRWLNIYFDKQSFENRNIALSRLFVSSTLAEKAPAPGKKLSISLVCQDEKHKAQIVRIPGNKHYILDYSQNNELAGIMDSQITVKAKRGQKVLRLSYAGQNVFNINLLM